MKKSNFLPKVVFELSSPKLDAEMIYHFLQSSWGDNVFKMYPDLKILLKGKNKKETASICNKFVVKEFTLRKKELSQAKKSITKDWNTVSKEFLKEVSQHLETEWPQAKKVIKGYISILPVFPRFLDEYSFCVGYRNTQKMREVIAHEIIHFLWFKKWKEVFPKSKRKEFEHPYLVWKLSEIIDPILLQSNPRLKKIIKPKSWGYQIFKTISIQGIPLTKYFTKVYKDSIKCKDSFNITMNKLYKEAKKNKKLLKF